MKSIVSRTLLVHKEHELLLKLEAAGLTDDLAQKVIDSKGNKLAMEIVGLISGQIGFEATVSQKLAREIMGNNFFGIEEVIKHFGVNPTKEQIDSLAEIPFSEKTLEECKETHILVAVFPLSIITIRAKVERKLFYNHGDAWYNEQAFAKNEGKICWQLIRKTPVPNSISKTWTDQQALLVENEETPTAQVMVYAIIGHFIVTGERLFENVYVRCSCVDSHGTRVFVGIFGSEGLSVINRWDDSYFATLGLSSVRKFD
jgi:hypothetical protein